MSIYLSLYLSIYYQTSAEYGISLIKSQFSNQFRSYDFGRFQENVRICEITFLDVKNNVIFDNKILMMAGTFMIAKQRLLLQMYHRFELKQCNNWIQSFRISFVIAQCGCKVCKVLIQNFQVFLTVLFGYFWFSRFCYTFNQRKFCMFVKSLFLLEKMTIFVDHISIKYIRSAIIKV